MINIKTRNYILRLFSLGLVLFFLSCQSGRALQPGIYAEVTTSKGKLLIALEYTKAPLSVANFIGLAEGTLDITKGKPFYNGLTFHRVEPGFVIQGGDPLGNGRGDPGYSFPNEIDPSLKHSELGIVAWANRGPNTNGCQFYITLDATPHLDGNYTIFGKVVDGINILADIKVGDVIKSVKILRVGSAAKEFKSTQADWDMYYKKIQTEELSKIKAANESSLASIKAMWPDMKTRSDNILSYTVLEGIGEKPIRGSIVEVSYKGMLPNGSVFDQSILHGGPYKFELGTGKVIPGWDKIILEMKKKEKRIVAIPPELAYGKTGVPPIIPPHSYLVYELELVNFTE